MREVLRSQKLILTRKQWLRFPVENLDVKVKINFLSQNQFFSVKFILTRKNYLSSRQKHLDFIEVAIFYRISYLYNFCYLNFLIFFSCDYLAFELLSVVSARVERKWAEVEFPVTFTVHMVACCHCSVNYSSCALSFVENFDFSVSVNVRPSGGVISVACQLFDFARVDIVVKIGRQWGRNIPWDFGVKVRSENLKKF